MSEVMSTLNAKRYADDIVSKTRRGEFDEFIQIQTSTMPPSKQAASPANKGDPAKI